MKALHTQGVMNIHSKVPAIHGKPRTTECHVIMALRVSRPEVLTSLATTGCGPVEQANAALTRMALTLTQLRHWTVGLRLAQATQENLSYEVSTTPTASPSWA